MTDVRSILAFAYAAGFTSKSTFNTAFKRQVGQTPTAYRLPPGSAALRTRSRRSNSSQTSRLNGQQNQAEIG